MTDMNWMDDIKEFMEEPESGQTSTRSTSSKSTQRSKKGSKSARTPPETKKPSRESKSKTARPASARAITSYVTKVSGQMNVSVTSAYNNGKEPGAARVISTLMEGFAEQVMETHFCNNKKKSLTARDVMAGVATVLGLSKAQANTMDLTKASGNSFAAFYNAGIDAVKKFSNSDSGTKENRKSVSERAGLKLPVTRIKNTHLEGSSRKGVAMKAAVFLAGVEEAMTESLLEEAGKVARADGGRAVKNEDIMQVIAASAVPGIEKSNSSYGDLKALLLGDGGAIPRTGSRSFQTAKAMATRKPGEELSVADPKEVILASTTSKKEKATTARKNMAKVLGNLGIPNQPAVLALA